MQQRNDQRREKRWLSQPVNHHIAYRIYGPASAKSTWVAVHGGPGGGASSSILQPFDLRTQRVVVFDQRGAGESCSRGSVRQNTTHALVRDMEALRENLGLSKWSLLAGSWGSVLALAYVSAHPERVQQMVLRGSFSLSRREIRGVLLGVQYGGHIPIVGQIARSRWLPAPGHQLAIVSRLLQSGALGVAHLRALRRWNLIELSLARKGVRRSMRAAALAGDVSTLKAQRGLDAHLARQWRKQAASQSSLRVCKADRSAWRKFRVQAHYLKKRGFLRPSDLDRAVIRAAASGVQLDWVHGRFDSICPPANTLGWVAKAERHACNVLQVQTYWPHGGHLSVEKPMLDAIKLAVQTGRGAR